MKAFNLVAKSVVYLWIGSASSFALAGANLPPAHETYRLECQKPADEVSRPLELLYFTATRNFIGIHSSESVRIVLSMKTDEGFQLSEDFNSSTRSPSPVGLFQHDGSGVPDGRGRFESVQDLSLFPGKLEKHITQVTAALNRKSMALEYSVQVLDSGDGSLKLNEVGTLRCKEVINSK